MHHVSPAGPDSATQLDACPTPHPTSVMHIHGTSDKLIRYDGGPGAGVARINGPPVPEVDGPAVATQRLWDFVAAHPGH